MNRLGEIYLYLNNRKLKLITKKPKFSMVDENKGALLILEANTFVTDYITPSGEAIEVRGRSEY